jgi:hypothetical protein
MIHVDFSRPLKVLKMSENLLIYQQNVIDRNLILIFITVHIEIPDAAGISFTPDVFFLQ